MGGGGTFQLLKTPGFKKIAHSFIVFKIPFIYIIASTDGRSTTLGLASDTSLSRIFKIKLQNSMIFPGKISIFFRFPRSSGKPVKYCGGYKYWKTWCHCCFLLRCIRQEVRCIIHNFFIYSLHKSHQNLPRIIKRLMSNTTRNEAFC